MFPPPRTRRPSARLLTHLTAITLWGGALAVLPAQAATSSATCSTPSAATSTSLTDVVEHQQERLDEIALTAGTTPETLHDHADDETLVVDECGVVAAVDPVHRDAALVAAAHAETLSPSDAQAPLEETFRLHSRPGASRTIHLDFAGATLTSGAWITSSGTVPGWENGVTVAPWSMDSDRTSHSRTELVAIQELWSSIAEDYAPFDVDVTTERPAPEDLRRDSVLDTRYGLSVLIGSGGTSQRQCSCGGVAWVNTFSLTGTEHDQYQYAFAFTEGAGTSGEYLAGTISHEAGHTLGLLHHGTASASYYHGSAPWSPIMGAGQGPLSQWSHGEYPSANNSGQNDVARIAQHLPVVADDHDGPDGTPTRLRTGAAHAAEGLIESRSDSDAFSFTSTGDPLQVTVTPRLLSGGNPNLDVDLTLLDSAGRQVAHVNPDPTPQKEASEPNLGAAWSGTLPAGEYTAVVRGGAFGDPSRAGQWSSYGSLGRYSITVTDDAAPLVPTSALTAAGVVGTAIDRQFSAEGGSGEITWSATDLPEGFTLSADGRLRGTPRTALNALATVTLTSGAQTSSAILRIVAHADTLLGLDVAPVVEIPRPRGTTGPSDTYRYTFEHDRSSGVAARFTGLDLPAWASVSTDGTLTYTLPDSGTHRLTVRMEAGGAQATSTLTLHFREPTNPITTWSLGSIVAKAGQVPDATLKAEGGDGTYRWRMLSGPAWMTVSPDGRVGGVPTTPVLAAGQLVHGEGFSAEVTSGSRTRTLTGYVHVYPDKFLGLADAEVEMLAGTSTVLPLNPRTGAAEQFTLRLVDSPDWAMLDTRNRLTLVPDVPGRHVVTVEAEIRAGSPNATVLRERIRVVVEVVTPITVAPIDADVVVGQAFRIPIAASGPPGPYEYRVIGATGDVRVRDGHLVGSVGREGLHSFTLNVSAGKYSVDAEVTLRAELPVVSSTAPALSVSGTQGQPVVQSVASQPGLRWSVTSGALPRGLSLTAEGKVWGTPQAKGSASFIVTGRGATHVVRRQVRLVVAAPVRAVSTARATRTVKRRAVVSVKVKAADGTPKHRFQVVGKTPTGMRLVVSPDGRSATVKGRVTRKGTWRFRVRVTDSHASTARSKVFTVRVR